MLTVNLLDLKSDSVSFHAGTGLQYFESQKKRFLAKIEK